MPELAQLERFLNTEKYPGVMREMAKALIINDKSTPGIFVKETDLARCGWHGKPAQLPDAELKIHMFGNGERENGLFITGARMIIVRGAFKDDISFVENSKENGAIEGIYGEVNHLYDEWEQNHPGEPIPYRRRRLILFYLVDSKGAPLHSKPLVLAIHGGAAKEFCTNYATYIEQAESVFAKVTGQKSAQGFNEKMCASLIWSPTFGSMMYGESRKSPIAYPESWVEPTVSNLTTLWPKKDEDIDHYEEVWDTCTPQVYASKYFKQCEKEIGFHALKPGVDIANCTLPAADNSLGARDATGAIAGGLK